jgi:hypothetical protein
MSRRSSIWDTDPNGIITKIVKTAANYPGAVRYDPADMIGMCAFDFHSSICVDRAFDRFHFTLETGIPTIGVYHVFIDPTQTARSQIRVLIFVKIPSGIRGLGFIPEMDFMNLRALTSLFDRIRQYKPSPPLP